MSDLKCSGSEWTLEECSWTAPSEECLTHAHDAIVFCSNGNPQGESQGQVRLIAQDGSPAIEGQGRPEVLVHGSWSPVCATGLSSGSPAVLCKAMGCFGCGSCLVVAVLLNGSLKTMVHEEATLI